MTSSLHLSLPSLPSLLPSLPSLHFLLLLSPPSPPSLSSLSSFSLLSLLPSFLSLLPSSPSVPSLSFLPSSLPPFLSSWSWEWGGSCKPCQHPHHQGNHVVQVYNVLHLHLHTLTWSNITSPSFLILPFPLYPPPSTPLPFPLRVLTHTFGVGGLTWMPCTMLPSLTYQKLSTS